ncbi:S9 family peptidase, partial [Candidatus Bathyarchaeota archaeon]|nr:S9 family peptidase [Candidatus Bathyarchaeota archaeon]
MKKLEDYKIMPIFAGAPVSDPQVSPSGTKTLFTYTEVNMEKNRYSSHIWLQDHRRKRPVQYTHGNGGESTPRWSPTGRRFLFLSGRHGERDKPEDKPKPQLFVMSASGGEAEKITYMDEAVMGPEWSPDGGRILFSARVFKGEKASEESDVKIIRRIKYRFDGKGYFEGKYVHLFTVPARGGKARQLTDGMYDVESYTWSSDGEKVAFVAAMGEDADLTHLRDIYTVPAKGGEPELLWKGQGPVDNLAWSPDGGYLAFTGRVLEDPDLVFYRNTEVFVLPIGGGEPRCLTAGFDRTVRGGLKWSPDGGSLYFLFPDKGSTQVGRVDLEGNVTRVTEGKRNIGSFTLARKGGVMVYNATDDSTPSELWIRDSKGTKKRTEMSRRLIRKMRWSQPEEFWFKASDGADVHGWIVKPHGYEEGVKYPTVLQVHGGPRGAYGYAMDAATHEFQVLAAYGYAVVYTNPRASVGYGEEFSAVVSGHWGERDYLDVMEAVDHVVKSYDYVDGSRLGIAGGSYGGYMT